VRFVRQVYGIEIELGRTHRRPNAAGRSADLGAAKRSFGKMGGPPSAMSNQLLHLALRDPRRMKQGLNGGAASGTEVGSYLVLRARISVGSAASRAPGTVAWDFSPLSTHFRLR